MIDVTKCKRRDGGEFVVYTTEGINQEYPIVGEVLYSFGWSRANWTANGSHISEDGRFDLIEAGPYDHIKPGDLVMVWDDHVYSPTRAIMREFVKEDANGYALVRNYYDGSAIVPWANCLTIEEYANKYLKSENTDE
jgi:hypothetical protein